jgi:hypothetical protein
MGMFKLTNPGSGGKVISAHDSMKSRIIAWKSRAESEAIGIEKELYFERAKVAVLEMLVDVGYDEVIISPKVIKLLNREFAFSSEKHCYLCLSQDSSITTGIEFEGALKIVCPVCRKRMTKKKEGDADEVAGCLEQGCVRCCASVQAAPFKPNKKNKNDRN